MPLTLPQNLTDFLEYRNIPVKRKWTILLCTALMVVFAAYRVSQQTPMYTTTARVLLSYEPPSVLDIQEVFKRDPWQPTRHGQGMASMALLTSRALAERVITRLELENQPQLFSPRSHSIWHYLAKPIPRTVRKKVKSLFAKGQDADQVPTVKDRRRAVADAYLRSLRVADAGGGLLQVMFTGTDPDEVVRVLNAHLKEFKRLDLELKFDTSDEARGWIEHKLQEARQRLEASELALLKYADENDIPPLDPDQQKEMIGSDYMGLVRNLSGFRQSQLERENSIRALERVINDPNALQALPADEDNQTIQALKRDLASLNAEYQAKSLQYGPEHPVMVRVRTQIRNTKAQIQAEARRILKSLELQRNYLQDMDQKLSAKMQEAEAEMQEKNRLLIQYQALQSEAASNREVYQQILGKLNLVKLMGNVQDSQLMSTIKIIDEPQPAEPSGGDNPMASVVKALVMGLCLGLGIAFLLEFLDNVIRTPKDVQRFFTQPFLGFFPSLPPPARDTGPEEAPFITVREPASPQAEAVRNIRTNIIFSFADRANHAIMFTSPNPVEGKTTVIANIAVTIAQLGKKTLVVSTDLRRPTLHKVFGLENLTGVSDVLIGEATLEETLQPTGIRGLDFLGSGTIPPNPSELLGSAAMAELIEQIKSRYEVILFDAPPVVPVVDPAILGHQVDGVCMVARSEQTTLPSMKQAVENLTERDVRVLGIILNDLDMEGLATQYGYAYTYYQEEGEGEEITSAPARA